MRMAARAMRAQKLRELNGERHDSMRQRRRKVDTIAWHEWSSGGLHYGWQTMMTASGFTLSVYAASETLEVSSGVMANKLLGDN